MKKEGGIIKSYAKGGSVDMDPDGADFEEADGFADGGITRDVMLNPEKYSAQMIDRSTKNGVIDDIVGLAALQQKNQETKERQAAAAMAQGTPPTIKDQILAEAQQLQGIDNAQSNLPTEYAGGGIVAFDNGGEVDSDGVARFQEGGRSRFVEGLSELFNPDTNASYLMPFNISPIKKLKEMGSYFTTPRQSPRDPDAQPGGYYGSGSNVPPEPPAAKPADTMTVERSKPTGDAKPSIMNEPAAKPASDMGAGGIDDLIRQSIGDIKASGQASKDARKEAKLMAMLQAGLGIMGGTSPFAAANFKGAMPALQGYQEEMRGIRGDEAKQIAQIAALNLKGAELKQELNKLGITEAHYREQAKLMAAQAAAYRAKAAGAGITGGAISSPTALKMRQDYRGYLSNPVSSPVFKSLDKQTQTYLEKANPSTASYKEAYKVFKNKLDAEFMGDVQFLRTVGNKRSDLSSLE
jgi:hypothetical protein